MRSRQAWTGSVTSGLIAPPVSSGLMHEGRAEDGRGATVEDRILGHLGYDQ